MEKLTLPSFKIYISIVINIVILAKGDIYISMEQNRETRNRPTQMCPTDFFDNGKKQFSEGMMTFQQKVL